MGSSSLLDVIGSLATGGLLLLIALRLNMSSIETRQTYGYNYKNQTNLTTLVMMIEDDFARIAYCANPANLAVNPAAQAIRVCDSIRFRYRTDIGNNGSVDSIEYSIGSTPDVAETENPGDYYLIKRIWNNGVLSQQNWNLGVTKFRFEYFRSGGSTTTPMLFPIDGSVLGRSPQNVGLMRLSIILESPEKPKEQFLGDTSQYQVFWKQVRVTSKNLAFR
jgi:hypothetical protein